MNHFHVVEADQIIEADKQFHALRKEFEKNVLALHDALPEHSEAKDTIKEYIDYMDDAYAETIEVATAKADETHDDGEDPYEEHRFGSAHYGVGV